MTQKKDILLKAVKKIRLDIDIDTYESWITKIELDFPERINGYDIIFDHDFAKSFFGNSLTEISDCPYCEYPGLYQVPLWQYHLQQMALEDDLFKYLKMFL